MELLSIQSFLQHGHGYHLYSYGEIENLPNGAILKDASEIHKHPEAIKNRDGKILGAAFSDVFRYKLLYDKGNFWADLDVVCLKPFVFAENVILATELHRASLKLDYRITDDRSKLGFGEIGPELLTRCAEKFGLQHFAKPVDMFNPIHYFNYRDIVNPRKQFAFSESTYAVHLWSGAWGKNKWKHKVMDILLRRPFQHKNHRFSANTLYGQLLNRYLYQALG
jgi:hypothetical protein